MNKRFYKILSISMILLALITVFAYKISFVQVRLSLYEDNESVLVYKRGYLIDEVVEPTRVGYRFVGWYEDEEFKQEWDFENTKVYKNTNIYAKWDRYFVINFYTNINLHDPYQRVELKEGNSMLNEELPIPNKEGYIFTGWYNKSVSPAEKIEEVNNISHDINLHAIFIVEV